MIVAVMMKVAKKPTHLHQKIVEQRLQQLQQQQVQPSFQVMRIPQLLFLVRAGF